MNIVQITSNFRSNGGVGSYLIRLCDALQAEGHAVTVIHSDRGAVSAKKNVPQHFVQNFDLYEYDRAVQKSETILQILGKVHPDIVHIHGNYNFRLDAAVREYYPLVKTMHVYEFCPSGNKYFHKTGSVCDHPTGKSCLWDMALKGCEPSRRPQIWWHFYRRCLDLKESDGRHARIIAASQFVRDLMLRDGYREDQVCVLPYFVPVVPEEDAVPQPGRILYCGRLVAEKGVDHLIRAVHALKDRIPCQLAVLGQGPDLERLQKMTAKMRIEKNIQFLGWREGSTRDEQYKFASVVAIPSLWPEPFCITGIEAMNFSRPVIAYRSGGIPEWLKDGESGYLAAPGDIRDLSGKLFELLENREKARAMGAAGRRSVEEQYLPQKHLQGLLGIYESVIGAHPKRAKF